MIGDAANPITYNPASQIVSEKRTDGANAGTYACPNYAAATRASTPDSLNQITQTTSTVGATVTFGYDPNGNLTRSGSTYYCYDAENRLTASDTVASCSSPTASLAYDPAGRLMEVDAGASKTRFAYDGLNTIAEYSLYGTLQRRYVFARGMDQPIF